MNISFLSLSLIVGFFVAFNADSFQTTSRLANLARNYAIYATPETINVRKLTIVKGPANIPANTELQQSPISIQRIPTLNDIRYELNNNCDRSYCMKSAGYPSQDVKESLYLNAWACLVQKKKIDELGAIDKSIQKKFTEEDLNTFGLI